MESELIPISEAARQLGVSIDTLRRWDESGRFTATRKSPGGNRYYSEKAVELFLQELFRMALEWAAGAEPTELPSSFYCSDGSIFQARLIRMQTQLASSSAVDKILSLLVAIAGEIGNNSFDHNLGNWPDMPGIFFGYDFNKREIVLADRGLGVLKTLQRVRPGLNNYREALTVAFTEMISGRAPEERGNGLKFVKKVIAENPISLLFQSGDAELRIARESPELKITDLKKILRGCIALIKY
jgi:MerR family regulatory protein